MALSAEFEWGSNFEKSWRGERAAEKFRAIVDGSAEQRAANATRSKAEKKKEAES